MVMTSGLILLQAFSSAMLFYMKKPLRERLMALQRLPCTAMISTKAYLLQFVKHPLTRNMIVVENSEGMCFIMAFWDVCTVFGNSHGVDTLHYKVENSI